MLVRFRGRSFSFAFKTLFLLGLCVCATESLAATVPGTPTEAASARLAKDYGKIPLSFEANQGQTDRSVRYISRGSGYSLFLTDTGAVLTLTKGKRSGASPRKPHALKVEPSQVGDGTAVVRMELAGASHDLRIAGDGKLPGKTNYFLGNDPAKWHSDLPTFAKVRYTGVYPGIDLMYYGNQQQLEYDFVVAPGADPKLVRLHFDGVEKLSVNTQGDLVIAASNGDIAFRKPVLYQTINGARHLITGHFQLLADHTAGFVVDRYDPTQTLVIDPVLVYSTYLGGYGAHGNSSGIAVDSAGDVYLTGSTCSFSYPVTPGAFQNYMKENGAVIIVCSGVVSKLNPEGTGLVYSTYLGGSGEVDQTGAEVYSFADGGTGIAIDAKGEAVVTGYTLSKDFPVTSGAFQTKNKEAAAAAATKATYYYSGFVTKLNAAGTGLVYSTYLGGSTNDGPVAVALDTGGNAYITGSTSSKDFPTTKGAYQVTGGGTTLYTSSNAFVTKLNPTGTGLVYSTFLGDPDSADAPGDGASAIVVDLSGSAYVAGTTAHSKFPTTAGAYQTMNSGGVDGFVAKFNSAGSALEYSTLLGGSTNDYLESLAVDLDGSAYAAGWTYSTNFPVTKGAFQTKLNYVNGNGFVTKLNTTGTGLVYSTYLGGTGGSYEGDWDACYGIAVDSTGDAYVVGQTGSLDFPITPDAYQHQNLAFSAPDYLDYTGFVTEFDPTGEKLIYSTFFGGNGGDNGVAAVLDTKGNLYIEGETYSLDFPTTAGAFQDFGITNGKGFVAKFNVASKTPIAAAPAFSVAAGTYLSPQTVDITDATKGASIYYTTNGATPTIKSTKYTKAIAVSSTVTIKAIAIGTGYAISTISSAIYTIIPKTATPVLSPVAGTYAPSTKVTITDSNSGATIYYTTNGTPPTTSSAKYTSAIVLTKTSTIMAIATATGHSPSAVATVAYTIAPAAATPVISPAAGTYVGPQTINIKDGTTGSTIYYTTNGTTPTIASTKYSVPFKLPATATVKGIATAPSHAESAVASTAYTIKNAAVPVFSPAPGTFPVTQKVTIGDSTAGATIYYTTNGTAPTTSSTKYSSPIQVSSTETINAIAVASGFGNSIVVSGTYTIAPIVAVSTTQSGNGVVVVPVGGEEVYDVSATNKGTQTFSSIIVSASPGSNKSIPVILTVCQTTSGVCNASPAASVDVSSFAPGTTLTFAVFVNATGAIANNSTTNRVFCLFKTPTGTLEGSTSVAVYTK